VAESKGPLEVGCFPRKYLHVPALTDLPCRPCTALSSVTNRVVRMPSVHPTPFHQKCSPNHTGRRKLSDSI
jgi:hypothetical protein